MRKYSYFFIIVLIALLLLLLYNYQKAVNAIRAPSIIIDDFSDGYFSVWPPQLTFFADEKKAFQIGILNTDDLERTYLVKIYPIAASDEALSAYNCNSFESCSPLEEEMQSWAQLPFERLSIPYHEIKKNSFSIQPSKKAVTGTYLFVAVACYSEELGTAPSTCTVNTNDFSSYFIIYIRY